MDDFSWLANERKRFAIMPKLVKPALILLLLASTRIQLLSIRISFTSIRFSGQDRESIRGPLLLLRNAFRQAMLHLRSKHSELDSSHDLNWLQSEIENLVSSATQEAAAMSGGSTATSFDSWTTRKECLLPHQRKMRTNGGPFQKRGPYLNPQQTTKRQLSRQELKESSEDYTINPFQSSCRSARWILYCHIHGLSVQTPPITVILMKLGFRLRHCPTSALYISKDTSRKSWTFPKNLDFIAQLNAFNIIHDRHSYMFLQSGPTLEQVDTQLRLGKISPYNVTKSGLNLLFFVSVLLLSFNATRRCFIPVLILYSTQRCLAE